MKKIFVFFIFFTVVILTGCSEEVKTGEYKSINEMLGKMQSYESKVKITYISNKGKTTYRGEQGASADGKYKIVTHEPESAAGCIILNDGKMVWQYNPRVDSGFSIKTEDKKERYELILFSFIKNYRNSENVSVEQCSTAEGSCTVLEAMLEEENIHLYSEKLWINNTTFMPVRLIIYDKSGNEKITEEFEEFNCNKEFKEDYFIPEK